VGLRSHLLTPVEFLLPSRIIEKEFSEYLSTFYRKPVFCSSSYYVASTGGAPIEKIKQYSISHAREVQFFLV
jgi:REP element-mobilizing transposase RayT